MASKFFNEPLGKYRPGMAAKLLLALIVVLAFAVLWIGQERLLAQIEGERGIAPVASSSDIQVSGIEINVLADTAEEARKEGWKIAQRRAWEKINGPKMSDAQVDAMVTAIVVEDERIGPRRYIARLGVIFDRTKASQFVTMAEGGSVHERSAPMLVIPILYSGGVRQVFEVRGPWQRAWANFQAAESPINYVRPTGSGGESLILTAGQPGRRSRLWWRDILGQFEAADVVVPVARLERQWPGGPVRGTFSARFGPDNKFLGSFSLSSKDEAGVPSMLDNAVRRIDAIFREALADGKLKPDPTLLAEERALDQAFAKLRAKLLPQVTGSDASTPVSQAQDVQTSPVVQSVVATYTVQFVTPDAASVDAAMAAVRGVPGVRRAVTSSLAIGGTSVMNVTMTGSLDGLAAALRGQGWQVAVGSNALRISR